MLRLIVSLVAATVVCAASLAAEAQPEPQPEPRIVVVTETALPPITIGRPRTTRTIAEAGLGTATTVTAGGLLAGAGAFIGVLAFRPSPMSSDPYPIYGALVGAAIGIAVGAPIGVYLAGNVWGGRGSGMATVLLSLAFDAGATLVVAGLCVANANNFGLCSVLALASAAIAPTVGAMFGYEMTDGFARRPVRGTSSVAWTPFAAGLPGGGGMLGLAARF